MTEREKIISLVGSSSLKRFGLDKFVKIRKHFKVNARVRCAVVVNAALSKCEDVFEWSDDAALDCADAIREMATEMK